MSLANLTLSRKIMFLCFLLVSIILLNSCSDSGSTSPSPSDNASRIAGKYKITAGYTTDNGWLTPPDEAKASITIARIGENLVTLTISSYSSSTQLPNVAVAFVSDKYVLSSYYSDGSLYGIISNNQLDVLLSVDDGTKIEFLAKK